IKILIVNNQALGLVRQRQESFYEERYSESLFVQNPVFVMLADSYGIRGMRVNKEEDVQEVLEEAIGFDGPVDVDCQVVQQTCVYPMIAPGKGIHEMIGVSK
ncbi:thiamine pyrophosphate-dependent enzyme, partial [Virgibacillus salexigens]|uniref:thiamine pyrophosphate-dependent enzyme n=1 Tax=Virgibacillus salexigens TaxID=61016 RepID=UPI0030818CEC